MRGKCIESCKVINVFIWSGFRACIVNLTILLHMNA